jgi:hypothetical protein
MLGICISYRNLFTKNVFTLRILPKERGERGERRPKDRVKRERVTLWITLIVLPSSSLRVLIFSMLYDGPV